MPAKGGVLCIIGQQLPYRIGYHRIAVYFHAVTHCVVQGQNHTGKELLEKSVYGCHGHAVVV